MESIINLNIEKHKDKLKAPYDTFGAPIIKVKNIKVKVD